MSESNATTTKPPKEPKRPRKRASHACVKCRNRKVRCDVTIFGPPCANCQLDAVECEVISSRRSKKNRHMSMPGVYNFYRPSRHGTQLEALPEASPEERGPASPTSLDTVTVPDPSPERLDYDTDDSESTPEQEFDPPYVSYVRLGFLTVTNLPAMLPEDIRFLDGQNCLQVPSPKSLDVFVRQYFRYLHPILPIIDEGAFWDMYERRSNATKRDGTISLLLFQAMLFACCNFVPRAVLRRLGFNTKRSARAGLYRRAKLLFDLGAESSSLDKARAALFLASWSFSSYEVPRTPVTPWLAIAIQHARDADAHLYDAYEEGTEAHTTRKRLWWGCILRDRLLGLGMRRPLHIHPADFDLARHEPLGPGDLKGEADKSMVYDAPTKERLAQVLGLLVRLCLVLTDVLDMAFPLQDVVPAVGRPEKIRQDLHRWYCDAVRRIRDISPGKPVHDAVFLNISLVRLYYYAARITLGHYEILDTAKTEAGFRTSQDDLQDAVMATTSCLESLGRARLVKRLPVTAVSCTALPLLFLALNAETSPAGIRQAGSTRAAIVQRRLTVLREAMETYQFQYEGVEWIRNAISQVEAQARHESVFDWDLIEGDHQRRVTLRHGEDSSMPPFRQGGYLFLASSLDVVFGKGRLPEDQGPISKHGGDNIASAAGVADHVVEHVDNDMLELPELMATPDPAAMDMSPLPEDMILFDEEDGQFPPSLDWLSVFGSWEELGHS
ncbi:fungal-specific transcription factor domain-containing protein [Plectosphaerella plurivora]|uniref:Fungal-specific transcription factor domain-containing protein n=1 Tax=Plectosphaerella plurivora TaxID=936078 RepID=A0A9P8VLD3_9PEZI|nr:fungal-specific transcription factor domain-containing protein [Plectosphaerella plurivora]